MARTSKKTDTPNFLSRLSTAPIPAKPGSKAKSQVTTPICGLEIYGAFHRVNKEITNGFIPTFADPIKNAMFTRFISEGVELGRCPENFKGTEGLVDEASLQLRRKGSLSKLTPEVVERFQNHEIRLHHDVQAPNTLRIKPEVFAANQELMNKMLDCLSKNGFAVSELFEVQEERGDWVVSEHTLDDLFAKAKEMREKYPDANAFTEAEIRELLELCSGMTIAPKWSGTFSEAFEMVRKIMSPTPEEQTSALSTAAKTKRKVA